MRESDRVRSHPGIDAREVFAHLDAGSDWKKLAHAAVRNGQAWSGAITYSRNISIPVTRICRNRCGYCDFVDRTDRTGTPVLPPEEIERLLRLGAESGCSEVLFLTGDRPEEASSQIVKRLLSWGCRSMTEYLVRAAETALRYGLLPHTNAGLLDRGEMAALRGVNASMGLMLESSSERLCEGGGPHRLSPGKQPGARLRCIEAAGELSIPFTTGILIGIGETPRERINALLLLRELHCRYGHLQEIIIQPFCPKPGTPMFSVRGPRSREVLAAVAYARLIFGPDMNIQVPPNLVHGHERFLRAGANDWGGVSPVSADLINPRRGWPGLSVLQRSARAVGSVLRERLPVYPEYIRDQYLHARVREVATARIDDAGYAKREPA